MSSSAEAMSGTGAATTPAVGPPRRTIFVQAHAQYRGVVLGVARGLKTKFDAEISLYVANAEQQAHYRRIDTQGLFSDIVVNDLLYRACAEEVPDRAKARAEAREHEKFLGVTINELSMSDRHLGRGYSLAGIFHPRSVVSERTDYDGLLNGFNRQIAFWRNEFETKKPCLAINIGKVPSVVARRMGVPTRRFTASRYRNLCYWAENEFLESPEIAEAFARLPESAGLDITEPAEGYLQARGLIRPGLAFAGMAKNVATIVAQRCYWRLRGFSKGRMYFARDEVRMIWRQYREMRRWKRQAKAGLRDLEVAEFVFFPLHVEPEAALHTLSPEFFFQLETIASTARDLPAGVMLAIKEHIAAMGRRPSEFIDQLASFKNVVLIDPDVRGIDVVRRARALVTITSSAGFEAAAIGKPVVTFGQRNTFNFLPHVRVVRDAAELKAGLDYALGEAFDAGRARRDGRRFLAAIAACSFDLGTFNYLKPDIVEDATVDQAMETLLRSIERSGRPGPLACPAA
ncbi:MAG: hypothetical protein U1F37_03495 [Alphaproteobacteria bacterium]